MAGLVGASMLMFAGTMASAEDNIRDATWLAEDIMGKGVIDNLQTTLEVSNEGKVSGLAGCNHFTGNPEISGQSITFDGVAVTQMACLPAVDEQERRFLKALGETKTYRFEDGSLYFLDGEGKKLIRFTELS